jgi:thioredoxin 1
VSDNHSDIVFAKVNTDDQQMLGAHFHVRSIPTLMIFREQVILYQQPGMVGASQLEALIAKTRELDMAQVHEEVRKEQEKAQQQGG